MEGATVLHSISENMSGTQSEPIPVVEAMKKLHMGSNVTQKHQTGKCDKRRHSIPHVSHHYETFKEAITEGLVSAVQTLGDTHTEYLVKRNKEMPPAAFPRHSEPVLPSNTTVKSVGSSKSRQAHKDRKAMSCTGTE